MRSLIEKNLLPKVNQPGQYIGGEWNSLIKDWDSCRGPCGVSLSRYI